MTRLWISFEPICRAILIADWSWWLSFSFSFSYSSDDSITEAGRMLTCWCVDLSVSLPCFLCLCWRRQVHSRDADGTSGQHRIRHRRDQHETILRPQRNWNSIFIWLLSVFCFVFICLFVCLISKEILLSPQLNPVQCQFSALDCRWCASALSSLSLAQSFNGRVQIDGSIHFRMAMSLIDLIGIKVGYDWGLWVWLNRLDDVDQVWWESDSIVGLLRTYWF